MSEIDRELTSLKSEKRMSEMAIKGYQNELAKKLNGSMGNDMMDVLSGKKFVKLTKWQKFRYKFDNFLKIFN
jgi:site-specific recombinase XerC